MGAHRPRPADPEGDLSRDYGLHGRRLGRPLRKGRRALLENVLPDLTVPLPPGGGIVDPGVLFGRRSRDLWVEIGFGGGEHMIAQAEANPDVGIIGCEPFVNGVARCVADVAARRLANVRVHPDDARPLLDALPDGSVGRAFILFPDPWPKYRHHKRRIVSPQVLDALARLMPAGAELRIATDDQGYLAWILRVVRAHPAFAWPVTGPDDWRRRPADWPPTRYEAKAIAAGRPPTYMRFVRGEG